jgi:hypothetical protein
MIQVQQNLFAHYGALRCLMHNMRRPYHTFSFFESVYSRTLDRSIFHVSNPFIIKLIYLISQKIGESLRRLQEIEGFLSECTPAPPPKRCHISGNSCVCTEAMCRYYKEPPELQ